MIENEVVPQHEKSLFDAIADFSRETELTPELLQSRRERIMDLEKALTAVPGSYGMKEFNEGKIKHFFASGVYGRELFIPKGNVIVSKIHRAKTFNVIAQGVISVICPTNGFNTYEGPFCFVSEPFTKRVVIAHEDTLWITSHGYTGSENLDDVEAAIIAKDFEELKFLKEEKI
jgi:hypothetical protein